MCEIDPVVCEIAKKYFANSTATSFADPRVTLIGTVARVWDEQELPKLRELYKAKHKNAYWVEFKDFSWWRMNELQGLRYIGGFARAGDITAQDYIAAPVDPIMAFARPVLYHMNKSHSDSTILMVEHYVCGLKVDSATMVGLDRLGVVVLTTQGEKTQKLRLPFPRPADDRKAVKTLIIEMTLEAEKASLQSTEPGLK